jgi:hypothetical protein
MKFKVRLMSLIFLLAILLASSSMATTYYVKKSGNDNNAGTSWTTAWLTTNRVQSTLAGGDTVFFGTGIWRGVNLWAPNNTSGQTTTYACSSFVQGIAQWWGSDSVSGWTLHSGNIYKRYYDSNNNQLYNVAQGDSILTAVSSLGAVVQGSFYHATSTDTVYVYCWGGGDPDGRYDMEICNHGIISIDPGADHTTIWGITMKFGVNHCITVGNANDDCPDFVHIEHLKATHAAGNDNVNQAAIYFARSGTTDSLLNSLYSYVRACTMDFITTQFGSSHNNAGFYSYGMTYCQVESCYFGSHQRSGMYIKGQNSSGITNYGCSYRYNYFEPMVYYGIHLHTNATYDSIYGNIFIGEPNGVLVESQTPDYGGGRYRIFNNTFIDCDRAITSGSEYCCVHIPDKVFKYNISYWTGGSGNIISIPSSDTAYWDLDSNMYYGGSMTWNGAGFTTWQLRGFDIFSTNTVNPNFANPGAGDYSRPGALQEMNLTYGGRTWTRFGGWQPPSGPDITPPVISNVRATDTTSVSVTIRWSTNEGATSRVEYGLTTSYGLFTILDPLLLWTHAQILPALSPSTVYHYRVYSRDAAGNQTISPDFTFRTLTPDLVAPAISGVGAHDITPSSATISWITDEAATSQVNYGTTSAYGSTTTLDPTPVLTHGVGLSSLTPNTLYHYRVRSQDAAGNEAVSGDFTFRSDTVWTMQLLSVGVPVTVSGTYAGYNPAVINDGVIDPRGGTSTTWASDADTANPHWIELTFSGSYRVGRARIYWAWNGSSSNWMCSQQYIIQYWDAGAGAFVNATVVNNSSADSVTLTDFPPVTTNRIRYWQPANMGPATYRRILWLTEFQLYGNLSGQDTIPPNRINDFQAEPGELEGGVGLQWTAPGSGDGTSVADRYDIRYSTSPIDESTWLQATVVADPPAPNAQGVAETFAATGLSPGIVYNFAIKSSDGAGNESPISNVVSSYSAGISPPMALETRVNSSTATAVLVGASVNSYLSVFYEFALDTTLAFASPRTDVSLLADSTVTCFFDSLSIDGYYYWRFRAAATDGSFTSAWSNVLGFDYNSGIGPALTNADCIFPTEGTTVQSSTPTFLVRLVPDVAHVYIQVASDISFSSPIESGPLAVTDGDIEWEASQPLQQGATYYWRASADNFIWTTPISFSAEVDIHPYPNPFRASENAGGVTFVNLPQNSRLTVATVSGSIVREVEGIGPDEWTWDVKNSGGGDLASGVYLYRVDFQDGSSSGKLMVIR